MDAIGAAAAGPAAGRRVPGAWLTRQPQVCAERLPQQVDLSPSHLGALIITAAGVLLVVSSWQVLGEVLYEPDPVILAISSVFPLIGIGLIGAGLVQLYRRQTVTFGEFAVDVWERGVTGARRFSAPYSDYLGVLQREHVVHRKNSSTTYQIIQLLHTDPAFDLPLVVTRGDTALRQHWESLAERLRLPALQLDDDRITARPAGALNASLAEQIRAGHLSGGHLPHGGPPASIDIRDDGHCNECWIELRHGRVPMSAYMIVALVLLPFLAMGFLHPFAMPMAGVGVALLAGIGWVRWKDATSPRTIRITEERVESHDRWRWSSADVTALDIAEIEGVRVYRKATAGSLVVAIESDRASMHLGHGLGRADLTWLRDFLIARIADKQARTRR